MKKERITDRATVEQIEAFEWHVSRAGHVFVAFDADEETQLNALHKLRNPKEGASAEHDVYTYKPDVDEPGLFRTFANTATTRENILEFANRYGRLGSTLEARDLGLGRIDLGIDGRFGIQLFQAKFYGPQVGEPIYSWASEILFMRTMVDLWLLVQDRDERKIGNHIRWKGNKATFQSEPSAESLRLPPPPTVGSEFDSSSPLPYVTELDPAFQFQKTRAWVVHPGRDKPDLVKYLLSESIETALYFLRVIVNRQLVRHSIERPRLAWVRREKLGWQHLPSSLISLLWLQFANAIAANRRFHQCGGCERWFEVAANRARVDKLYCTPTCRVRIYRARKAEARQLHSLGSTVDELAERFDAAPETIRAWINSEWCQ